jgi:hypothetical protein
MSLDRASQPDDSLRFPRSLLQLVTFSSRRTVWLAVVAIAIAWLPPACLSGLRGLDPFWSFLSDYAAQSRMLFLIPLLILAEPRMVQALEAIANHFREEELIKNQDLARFESALKSFGEGDSLAVRVIMAFTLAVIVALAFPAAPSASLRPWCYEAGSTVALSLGGSWYIAVSHSILLLLLFRWIWRQVLWLWFLGVVSRLDLQLIPAHPDRSGGLSFLEISLRAFVPFGLALGTIVAGGVANRVVYFHRPLETFGYLPLVVAAVVVVLCVGPLCVFFDILSRTRRRGVFEYGALALTLGRHFEKKWLAAPSNTPDQILGVPDFSATIDLYSVVANVHQMNAVPFGVKSVGRLVAAALAPVIPLALVALPFDVSRKT